MIKDEKKVKFEFSAGGVVLNKDHQVLIIKTKNLKGDTVYTFPKGHIEPGETTRTAAIREVEEETGVKAEIVEKIQDVEYWFVHQGMKIHKRVSWFLMKPLSIKKKNRNVEVEDIIWYDINKVKEILSYSSDKELIDKLRNKIISQEK